MSHAISSSGSEDEGHGASETRQRSQEQSKRVPKYESPADFVPYKYSSSASALLESSDQTELWLIKAPAHFDPESLAGLKVSLSGLQMIQSTGNRTPQIYSVLGNGTSSTDLHLLTSSCKNQDVSLSASAFTGVLSISESYGDCSANQCPIAIPAAPAPSIPLGLRQSLQPFGNSATPQIEENTASAPPSPPKRATLDLEESKEQRKKNKKKKKEKRSKEESIKEQHIKEEDISFDYGEIQTPQPVEKEGVVERKKKKKMKKEKERRDILGAVAADGSLIAKLEPMDTSYGDNESPVKKKKKKKKTPDE